VNITLARTVQTTALLSCQSFPIAFTTAFIDGPKRWPENVGEALPSTFHFWRSIREIKFRFTVATQQGSYEARLRWVPAACLNEMFMYAACLDRVIQDFGLSSCIYQRAPQGR
jgi:hypothetical protein